MVDSLAEKFLPVLQYTKWLRTGLWTHNAMVRISTFVLIIAMSLGKTLKYVLASLSAERE